MNDAKWTTDARYRSRKWIGFLLILLILTSLRIADYINEDLTVNGLLWLFGLFAGANVGEKFSNANLPK